MQRRQFLSLSATLPLAFHLRKALAGPLQSDSPRFLLVFLRGAYDCNNLLVPTHSDFYYQARPTIAIARPGEANGALALNGQWGLHPALQGSLLPLFEQKQACFVPFAGSNDLSRSHFETQDSIELGQPLEGRSGDPSGFLNRLAQVLQKDSRSHVQTLPMAFTAQLPLSLRGSAQVANMALTSGRFATTDGKRSQLISSMYQGTSLDAAVRGADLVITGEGRFDAQTLRGKTPFGVARIAQRRNDDAGAQQWLDRIDAPEQLLAAQVERANMLARQGRIDEAVQALQRGDFGWQTSKMVGGEVQQTIGYAQSAIGGLVSDALDVHPDLPPALPEEDKQP